MVGLGWTAGDTGTPARGVRPVLSCGHLGRNGWKVLVTPGSRARGVPCGLLDCLRPPWPQEVRAAVSPGSGQLRPAGWQAQVAVSSLGPVSSVPSPPSPVLSGRWRWGVTHALPCVARSGWAQPQSGRTSRLRLNFPACLSPQACPWSWPDLQLTRWESLGGAQPGSCQRRRLRGAPWGVPPGVGAAGGCPQHRVPLSSADPGCSPDTLACCGRPARGDTSCAVRTCAEAGQRETGLDVHAPLPLPGGLCTEGWAVRLAPAWLLPGG